jgi:hypothetical protein
MSLRIPFCLLVLTAGCSSREEPTGPGRFSVSTIRRTIAPNDGHATQLCLCENPLQAGEPTTPYVSVYICKAPSDLSGQRVRLKANQSRFDQAQWVPAPNSGGTLPWVEVEFGTVREGAPVEGTYELELPDGTKERGRFQATWLKSEGRGG